MSKGLGFALALFNWIDMRIKNLTGSPYQLTDKTGAKVMLPAFGEVVIDPHHMHEPYYRQVGYFKITDSENTAVSEPEADTESIIETESTETDLREEYRLLAGKEADGRWSEKRIVEEIDNLKA